MLERVTCLIRIGPRTQHDCDHQNSQQLTIHHGCIDRSGLLRADSLFLPYWLAKLFALEQVRAAAAYAGIC
jgi:hypothetical protein